MDVSTVGGRGASALSSSPRERDVGGEGTLVEFGNGKGSLTLNVLTFTSRGGRA